jgi:molybdopterin converting factor small subunit
VPVPDDGWYAGAMSGSHIVVRLFAGLEQRAPQGRAELRLTPAEAPTVEALLQRLGLHGRAGLVLVNGVHSSTEQALGPGDEVDLFPPVGGG